MKIPTSIRVLLFVAACVLLPGAGATAQTGSPSDDTSSGTNKSDRPVSVPKKPKKEALPVISTDYRIGVSDVLEVHVWKEPELSRVVTVRPDGKVSLPLAGELVAKGKTATQLRKMITERLKEFVSAPEVTVIVNQINRLRYFVIGEVNQPGAYPLLVPVTLTQALAMAGGLGEWADKDRIMIQRRISNGRTIRIYFNYKAWIKNTWEYENIALEDGDVVVVP